MRDLLEQFWEGVPFPPDPFQVKAAEAVADGASVVVTAPTGSGKTLIAEAAVHLSLAQGRRAFYTAPIKALSNQKFADFAAIHGPAKVGLLTGDNVINPGASLIVATLEVLRNMIYADPGQLDDVGLVVLDEVHYLQDPFRGAAWEEVIIHCPEHIRFVCLSATISNDGEFADWIEERRGRTELISTDHRPVPLESLYMVKERSASQTLHLLPTFVTRDGRRRPNPRIERLLSMERGRRRRYKTPNRTDTVERLDRESLLPAIYFIFSRAGCDAAARLVDSGVRLTNPDQRSVIRALAEERTSHLADDDLAVLDYDRWLIGLEAGVASHHAGQVPAFKETVEELFGMGLVRVVFATETLALGINMPARSVVLENLSKFTGESHELLRPGDYTQLTGRAGRRGIDTDGFGIVLHSPFVDFGQVTEIASMGAHELRSSFGPTYNMTANLVANYEEHEAAGLLEASFAAFQREERLAEAGGRIAALEEQLHKTEEQARCDRGDVEEYLALVEATGPARRQDGVRSLLGAGDVLDVVGGARDGRYAVLKRLSSKAGGARYLVLSTSGRVSTIGHKHITDASQKAGTVDLPAPMRPRDRRFIQDTLRLLRKMPPRRSERSPRQHHLPDHPVASCPDAEHHLSALHRANRIRRRIAQHRAAQRSAGHGLVEEFTAIRALLDELGYLEGWSLTPRGERLRRIYNEMDLLLTEAVERGLLYGLDPPDLAAVVSAFVYEPRMDKTPGLIWPTTELSSRWAAVDDLWIEIAALEQRHHLAPTRRPDPGFALIARAWTAGEMFADLPTKGMAPGDFVRNSRQLADVLRQLRDAVDELSEDAAETLAMVDRGVVAAQGIG